MHATVIYNNIAIMAKKRSKDKDDSPEPVSKKSRLSGKKKNDGKVKETEEIAASVLAGKTAEICTWQVNTWWELCRIQILWFTVF